MSALVGFLLTLKIKVGISIDITSFFGAFLTTIGVSILLEKIPLVGEEVNGDGEISLNYGQIIILLAPYLVSILTLTILGMTFQKHLQTKARKAREEKEELA